MEISILEKYEWTGKKMKKTNYMISNALTKVVKMGTRVMDVRAGTKR